MFSSYVNCSYILFHKLGLKDQKKSPHTLAHRPSPQKKSGQKWSEVDRGDGLKHQVWMWLPHLLVIWLTKTHLITRCKQGLNERVIQSFKRLIHSETKQSKWLSLWMGHWITRIVHNMDSFSNKTLLFCLERQKFCCGFVWTYFHCQNWAKQIILTILCCKIL